MNKPVEYRLDYEVCSDKWVSTLLGGEIANCHGYGDTPEEAKISLSMSIKAARRKKFFKNRLQYQENPQFGRLYIKDMKLFV